MKYSIIHGQKRMNKSWKKDREAEKKNLIVDETKQKSVRDISNSDGM